MRTQRASRSWRQAIRSQQSVAVLMLDVDHFKAYNDHYGHAAGDLALQAVARTLGQHAQRPLDMLARGLASIARISVSPLNNDDDVAQLIAALQALRD